MKQTRLGLPRQVAASIFEIKQMVRKFVVTVSLTENYLESRPLTEIHLTVFGSSRVNLTANHRHSSSFLSKMPAHTEDCIIDNMSKNADEFRNYVNSDRQSVVENHYRLMRTNQSVEFVDRMAEKYSFDKPRAIMSIREAFRSLETYVDSSDPDVE